MKYLATYALVAVSLFSCSENITFVDTVDNPAGLIDNIGSYQSIDAARAHFVKRGFGWRVVEDSRSPRPTSRPPFNIYAAKIDGYVHLDHAGSLELIFFNNRLMSTFFFPHDLGAYLESLKQKGRIDLVSRDEVIHAKHTRIWKHRDFRGLFYVAWEDTRLAEEQRIWIRRYS